jgi:hypothetical protein
MRSEAQSVLATVAAISWLSGLVLLLYQSFRWLLDGSWPNYSLLNVLNAFGPAELQQWVWEPGSWLGLHKLLAWLPSSLFLLVCVPMLALLTISALEASEPSSSA